jgi:hypothetical protein
LNNTEDKDIWLRERKLLFNEYPLIKSVMYFNMDATIGSTKQVL